MSLARLVGSSSTTMPSQSTPAKAAKVRSCSPSKLQIFKYHQSCDSLNPINIDFLTPRPHKNRACIEWLPGTVTSCWRSRAKTLKRLNWKTHWIRSLNESWIEVALFKFKKNYTAWNFSFHKLYVTGDGGVQVHRGQGCVPKVLQQDAGEETGKNSVNCICVLAKFCSLYLDFVASNVSHRCSTWVPATTLRRRWSPNWSR